MAFKDDTIKELVHQLRGQQSAINLLIQTAQMRSISDIKQLLKDNAIVLERVARGTRSLRSSRPQLNAPKSTLTYSQSVHCSSTEETGSSIDLRTEFEFDDLVVNSRVYRRALQAAWRAQPRAPGVSVRSKFLEGDGDGELDGGIDRLRAAKCKNEAGRDFIDVTNTYCLESPSNGSQVGNPKDLKVIDRIQDESPNDEVHSSRVDVLRYSMNNSTESTKRARAAEEPRIIVPAAKSSTDADESECTPSARIQERRVKTLLTRLLRPISTETKPRQRRTCAVNQEGKYAKSHVKLTADDDVCLRRRRIAASLKLEGDVDSHEVSVRTITAHESILIQLVDHGLGTELLDVLSEVLQYVPSIRTLWTNLSSLRQRLATFSDYISTNGGSEAARAVPDIVEEVLSLVRNIHAAIKDFSGLGLAGSMDSKLIENISQEVQGSVRAVQALADKVATLVPKDFENEFRTFQRLKFFVSRVIELSKVRGLLGSFGRPSGIGMNMQSRWEGRPALIDAL
ncbi:hypothetical protein NA57DRAFT_79517 [Rhizodiscina lignyota]|uniref:Uncharacterized protein n=1 Tax=Rhizodiscina lignyota TaxID=1504668 RepID=A0A9P4IB37_9PEZI|nr:hypothetical protein NA57DRAFT_79517 [Rhizodiscina lignyota]